MEVIIVCLIISFIWGVEIVIHKHLLKDVDQKVVFVIGGTAVSICLLLYYFFNLAEINKGIRTVTPTQAVVISTTMIFVSFVAILLYFYILSKHDSYVVSSLIYSSPFFTLLFAYFFLDEQITLVGALGVIFITIGVVCVGLNAKP